MVSTTYGDLCSGPLDCGCGSNGRCSSTGPGCECDVGYLEVKELPRDRCQDIDECLDSPCGSLEERYCRNTRGSYECVCFSGVWDGQQCGMYSLIQRYR